MNDSPRRGQRSRSPRLHRATARLEEAVATYRHALEKQTRKRVPLDWAATQNNLGVALQALGERESDTARLEEAVAAYREALMEWSRERVPLNWAGAYNNLGDALRTMLSFILALLVLFVFCAAMAHDSAFAQSNWIVQAGNYVIHF